MGKLFATFFSTTMLKIILRNAQSCSAQKTACKNTKQSRYEIILKILHFGKSIAHAKWASYFQPFFFRKTMLKMILRNAQSCSVQITACKKTKQSRYEIILKILHFGKSIAHARWASYFQLFFSQNHAENDSTECIELFCAKNRVQQHQIVEI